MPDQVKRTHKRMQGTVILVGVIVVLIYGLVSVPAKAAELATNIAEAVPAPQQQRPAPGTALTLPGNLQAWHDSPIYAHVKGYLKDWYVDFGAEVKAGQLLAEIDTPDLDANLFAAEARLSAARAKVETRQAGLEFAKSTYQRWRDAPTGVVSVQGTLAKQDDFEMATARLLAAMADANVEEREVERLRAHQTSKRITAPFDGVITERNIDIGAPVNDSCGTEERANAALFRIIDLHKIRIFVKVPQEMSGGIKAGLKATLSLPQFPGKVFPAAVVSYSHAIDAKSQTLLVELNADNPDGALQPGSSGQVEFELPSNP